MAGQRGWPPCCARVEQLNARMLAAMASEGAPPRKTGNRKLLHALGQILFNRYGTHLPSRRVRKLWLRALGASLAPGSVIFAGTTVLGADRLAVGARANIGWRCVLDARGGLNIGADTVVASDSQLISGRHDFDDDEFVAYFDPITIGDHCWLATRSLVIGGVTIGRGAVVAAGAVVTRDVDDLAVVAGVPAKLIRKRTGSLDYRIDYDPPLH
jgi:putative colanic acid biosynthesis acetyltransferase WcaF